MYSFHLREEPQFDGERIVISEQRIIKHLRAVRIKRSEEFIIFWNGLKLTCETSNPRGKSLEVKINACEKITRGQPNLILAVGALTGGKLEEVAHTVTQLGIDTLLIAHTSRAVEVIKSEAKKERIINSVYSACEVASIPFPPEVVITGGAKEIVEIADKLAPKPAHRFLFYELEEKTNVHLSNIFSSPYDGRKVFAVIGPEGGFEGLEADFFRDADFECVSLGNRILDSRAATYLAVSALSLWMDKLRNR